MNTCLKCKNKFPVKPYRKIKAKYCSYDCYWGRSEDRSSKECSKCKEELPISWFQKVNRGHDSRCRNCKNKEFKNWSRRNDVYQRFRFYEWNAKRNKRDFDLTLEFFKNKIEDGKCYYCGQSDVRLGLDRLDSKKGYTTSNVFVCCRRCNVAKNDMTYKDFISLCHKIVQNHDIT